jgi:hypothetical protein
MAAVFSPFGPGDSLRVYRLQGKGLALDLKRGLIQPQSPLREAWLAYLTQQAMGQPTYVSFDPHSGEAFVQVRFRPHQAAADVAFLAPALEDSRNVSGAWSSLLDGACAEAAGRGIQRLFASLPESGAEVDVFHHSGFRLYASEDVYRLAAAGEVHTGGLERSVRARKPDDWPALQKLCVAVTPQQVRLAEGGITLSGGGGRDCQQYVVPRDGSDDLLAAFTICGGGLANWLRMVVHPAAGDIIDDLVQRALAQLADQTDKPLYCNVRRYEGGVRAALDAAGFELYASRALLVRPTLAWVKSPAFDPIPARQAGAEPVPPTYHINGEPELQPSNGRLAVKR